MRAVNTATGVASGGIECGALARWRGVIGLLALLCTALAIPGPAKAQVNEAFSDLAGEIETVRSMAQTERKAVVADNMALTATESEAFWPLYNKYRYDVSLVEDRHVGVITDYAAHIDTLDDAEARQLLDRYLAYQSDLVKLRAEYVKRFAKVLPGTKLARYFQIEDKLDAVSNLTVASQIPLVE